MLTMLPRLTEASRIQSNAENQTHVTQHAATTQIAQKAQHDQQSVHTKDPTEKSEIHRDGRGASSHERDRRQRKRPEKPQEPPQGPGRSDPTLGLRLDVKV